jgi:CRISPR-associated protein Cas2
MLKRYLITYDIPATKRRTKVHDLLQGYGFRVNNSVFEITISPTQMKTLTAHLYILIKPKDDSVRIYTLCLACAKDAFALGKEPTPFKQNDTQI